MKQIKEKMRVDIREKYKTYFEPWEGKDLSAQHRFVNTGAGLIMSFEGNPVLQSFDEGKGWMQYSGPFSWPKRSNRGIFRCGRALIALDASYIAYSFDDGLSWIDAVKIPSPDTEHFRGLGSPNCFSAIITQRGNLVMVADNFLGQEGPDGQLISATVSQDGGRTWHVSRLFGPADPLPNGPEGFGEPTVVELRSQWLWMCMRTLYGEIWQSISRDGGYTWNDPTPTGLVSPIANCYAARDPFTAATVLCFNHTIPGLGQNFQAAESVYRPRNNLVFMVSHDNCRTWTCPVTVDAGGAFYPTIHFTKKTMFIMYQSNEDETKPWADHGLTLVTYNREEVNAIPEWTAETIQPYIEAGLVRHWLALACHRPTKEAIESWIS